MRRSNLVPKQLIDHEVPDAIRGEPLQQACPEFIEGLRANGAV